LLDSYFGPVTVDCLLEQGAISGRKASSVGPGLVRSRSGGAVGPGGGVGFGLSSRHIVAGPVNRTVVAGGVLCGAGFQRTNACFDGAIVPRPVGGREQHNYPRLVQKRARDLGNKGRTVIAFQDQGSAVPGEEHG